MPIFLIFVVIPFIEISVFMMVGDEIGILNALLLSLFTAITGGAIFRYQGLRTFHQAMESMNHAQIPVKELFDGFCLVIAASMLVTPGFVTDVLGFSLLVPPVRELLRAFVSKHMNVSVNGSGNSEFYQQSGSSGFTYKTHSNKTHSKKPDVIEGEYEKVDGE